MSLTAGIVGLPNVGKSTLFNAITNSKVEAANYPFATINPNTGVVEVPDARLDDLCQIFHTQKRVAATFEFTDIAGLVKGASQGAGLGNKFLANIRNTDAICHVVRCFDDENIIHVEGTVNSVRDADIINLELVFADLATVEKRIDAIGKRAISQKEKDVVQEYELCKALKALFEDGRPARALPIEKETLPILKSLNLLTSKPMIYVGNVSETDIQDPMSNPQYKALAEKAKDEGAEIVPICASLEADISEIDDPEERVEFLHDLGIEESGLDKLIKASYSLLGLQTFLTGGENECRAWTFHKGMTAPQCAGIIHSDFERGFIKAEIYAYEDLKVLRTEKAIKEAGKYRIEGKEYVMQDGDVVFFRFNV